MRKRLKEELGDDDKKVESTNLFSSFDTVGDIAIMRLPEEATSNTKIISQMILKNNKGVKTVLAQTAKVAGEYRLRKLTWLAGENKTRTSHKEHGCIFSVDVESCYFSPRLSGERLRIAGLVQPCETVVNMFAGVGCFSILIARRVSSARIYSIDLNPKALQFMKENIRLNRVYGRVIPLLGDSKEIIEKHLQRLADRVLMPLPEKALEYLPAAVSSLKPSGGWIHIHSFERATNTENAIAKVKLKIGQALSASQVSFRFGIVREVRSIGPNWFQIVADVQIFPLQP